MILAVDFGNDASPHEVQQRAFELIALWRRPIRIVFGSGDAIAFDENGGSRAEKSPQRDRRRAAQVRAGW